jgi:hypothetical protein
LQMRVQSVKKASVASRVGRGVEESSNW